MVGPGIHRIPAPAMLINKPECDPDQPFTGSLGLVETFSFLIYYFQTERCMNDHPS